MNDLQQEEKVSIKSKGYVLACLAILLLGVAIFRDRYPALRSELSNTLFIVLLMVMVINLFRRKKS
jgi:uncharacterized membrane protein YoaK (UPF0700 family)